MVAVNAVNRMHNKYIYNRMLGYSVCYCTNSIEARLSVFIISGFSLIVCVPSVVFKRILLDNVQLSKGPAILANLTHF